ncbi:MAG: YrdB family protein [Streptococcaceae bacterium]|jgi:hypothetical protein|nr:YrdB family protein [Streptococcaceae bacterium]
MKILILLNGGLRLSLELVSFFTLLVLGFWKFKPPLSLALGLILPLGLAALWAIFVAPSSAHRASEVVRLLIECLVFISVFLFLKISGFEMTAIFYLAVALANTLAIHLLK